MVTYITYGNEEIKFIDFSIILLCYLVLSFVAFKINSAVSTGYDINDAWLALTVTVVALIRFAKRRCISGGFKDKNLCISLSVFLY